MLTLQQIIKEKQKNRRELFARLFPVNGQQNLYSAEMLTQSFDVNNEMDSMLASSIQSAVEEVTRELVPGKVRTDKGRPHKWFKKWGIDSNQYCMGHNQCVIDIRSKCLEMGIDLKV